MGRYHNHTTTISVRLNDDELERLDHLVEVGFGRQRYESSFKKATRADAVRNALRLANGDLEHPRAHGGP